jgi:hypothetical protein
MIEAEAKMRPSAEFDAQFCRLTGHVPFPWQQASFRELLESRIPKLFDIPTRESARESYARTHSRVGGVYLAVRCALAAVRQA